MKHQVHQERQDDSIASNSETNDAIAKQCADAAFQVHTSLVPLVVLVFNNNMSY